MLMLKDYAWGLAVLDLVMQSQNDKIQVGVMFKNASDGPIRYLMKSQELKLNGCIRSSPDDDPQKSAIIARDCNNLFYFPIMSRISAQPTPKVTGMLDFECEYGHPDFDYVRRMKMTFNIMIAMVNPPQIMPSIVSHEEFEIKHSIN